MKQPISVEGMELLYTAEALLREKEVDTLVVTEEGKAIGMVDVQDLIKKS
jgi:transaldolase